MEPAGLPPPDRAPPSPIWPSPGGPARRRLPGSALAAWSDSTVPERRCRVVVCSQACQSCVHRHQCFRRWAAHWLGDLQRVGQGRNNGGGWHPRFFIAPVHGSRMSASLKRLPTISEVFPEFFDRCKSLILADLAASLHRHNQTDPFCERFEVLVQDQPLRTPILAPIGAMSFHRRVNRLRPPEILTISSITLTVQCNGRLGKTSIGRHGTWSALVDT